MSTLLLVSTEVPPLPERIVTDWHLDGLLTHRAESEDLCFWPCQYGQNEVVFEGDPAADRLLLLGHIDHTAAAFADLLKQFVAPDAVTGLFPGRRSVLRRA